MVLSFYRSPGSTHALKTTRSSWPWKQAIDRLGGLLRSAAGKRAKHFYDRVIRELVNECDFSLELWNFQVLAFPEIGNSAAEAAAQADIVIISMHRKG